MVEPWIVDPVVGGSNPLIHPIFITLGYDPATALDLTIPPAVFKSP